MRILLVRREAAGVVVGDTTSEILTPNRMRNFMDLLKSGLRRRFSTALPLYSV